MEAEYFNSLEQLIRASAGPTPAVVHLQERRCFHGRSSFIHSFAVHFYQARHNQGLSFGPALGQSPVCEQFVQTLFFDLPHSKQCLP
jgi:hypothetical protein